MRVCPTSPDYMPQLSAPLKKGMRPSPNVGLLRYRPGTDVTTITPFSAHCVGSGVSSGSCPCTKLELVVPEGAGLISQAHAASSLPQDHLALDLSFLCGVIFMCQVHCGISTVLGFLCKPRE